MALSPRTLYGGRHDDAAATGYDEAVTRVPRSFVLLGQRFPAASTFLTAAVLVLSILAVGAPGLLRAMNLVPALVFQGQLWRLLTWPLFALEPITLIFGCLALMWLGRDLCHAWGPGRFLTVYFGLSFVTGVLICLLTLVWEKMGTSVASAWVPIDGLMVAWALTFPSRSIALMLVVPLAGWNLVWGLLAIVTIFGLMGQVVAVVPHYISIGLMLLYVRQRGFETLWLRLRYKWLQLRLGRRKSTFRVVEKDDSDPPRWMH